MSELNSDTRAAIEEFERDGELKAIELMISGDEALEWVRIRVSPPRFTPSMFIGNWSDQNRHPDSGEIRILRIMAGPDGVTRAIARQGKNLYCWSPD